MTIVEITNHYLNYSSNVIIILKTKSLSEIRHNFYLGGFISGQQSNTFQISPLLKKKKKDLKWAREEMEIEGYYSSMNLSTVLLKLVLLMINLAHIGYFKWNICTRSSVKTNPKSKSSLCVFTLVLLPPFPCTITLSTSKLKIWLFSAHLPAKITYLTDEMWILLPTAL